MVYVHSWTTTTTTYVFVHIHDTIKVIWKRMMFLYILQWNTLRISCYNYCDHLSWTIPPMYTQSLTRCLLYFCLFTFQITWNVPRGNLNARMDITVYHPDGNATGKMIVPMVAMRKHPCAVSFSLLNSAFYSVTLMLKNSGKQARNINACNYCSTTFISGLTTVLLRVAAIYFQSCAFHPWGRWQGGKDRV